MYEYGIVGFAPCQGLLASRSGWRKHQRKRRPGRCRGAFRTHTPVGRRRI